MTISPKLPKHVHVIGICGVATSALAIAFQEHGIKVTGSDKGFFPPISTELEKHKISFYAGWHPEKMVEGGTPDVVMIGAASGSQNPETLYAKEHNIPMYSYPEIIGAFFAKENSIVCVGTWGKTSSSALLSFILDHAGYNPTYMFGGVSISHESSARLSDSKWSVFEGDEYKSSPTDQTAKFFYYNPTHLLLTAVSWDHADLYPTETAYFDTFKKLLRGLQKNTAPADKKGFIVGCADHEGVRKVLGEFNGKKILYGRDGGDANEGIGKSAIDKNSSYTYSKIHQGVNGLDLTITHDCKEYIVHSPMLGTFQAENITGCFAMAHELGIAPEKIVEAIATFKGLKRRMEKRLDVDVKDSDDTKESNNTKNGSGITIIDDIAHSPEKARSVLSTLRAIYKGKVIVVFEPNIGGRSRESAGKYDNAFDNADVVIIPRLTKLKVADDSKASNSSKTEIPMEGDELAATIGKTHKNVHYLENDEKLVTFLETQTKAGDVIAFLGSHGFRGMIEETINKIDQ